MVSYSVGEPTVQESNVLQSRWYHCNMHLKIGHGHEECLDKEACVVFASNNHADFSLGSWKKIPYSSFICEALIKL